MRVTVFDCCGLRVECLEGSPPPRPVGVGVVYVVYEFAGLKVATRLERLPGRGERERVVAVSMRGRLRVYEHGVPEGVLESLGYGGCSVGGRRGITVS